MIRSLLLCSAASLLMFSGSGCVSFCCSNGCGNGLLTNFRLADHTAVAVPASNTVNGNGLLGNCGCSCGNTSCGADGSCDCGTGSCCGTGCTENGCASGSCGSCANACYDGNGCGQVNAVGYDAYGNACNSCNSCNTCNTCGVGCGGCFGYLKGLWCCRNCKDCGTVCEVGWPTLRGCCGGRFLAGFSPRGHGKPKAYTGPYTGPSGPQTAAYAYPYYTTRAPRDFLMKNPPSIGP